MDSRLLFRLIDVFVLPVTIIAILLVLRPALKRFFDAMRKVEFKGLDLKALESAGFEASGTENGGRADLTRIAESSKEKLEKLRLVLESEQVHQVVQYHAQSLAQSRISFWFSIGAAAFGFLVIVIGVVTLFMGISTTPSYASIGAGVIIDAISALFFTQSNRARRLMTEFFDKLRRDRQFNESLRLCRSITDDYLQSLLKVQLSLFFAGIPVADEITQTLISQRESGASPSADTSHSAMASKKSEETNKANNANAVDAKKHAAD